MVGVACLGAVISFRVAFYKKMIRSIFDFSFETTYDHAMCMEHMSKEANCGANLT